MSVPSVEIQKQKWKPMMHKKIVRRFLILEVLWYGKG